METTNGPSSSRSSSMDTDQQSPKRKEASMRASGQALYVLAHPAPVFTDKTHFVKHLRPKLHLQLQRPSADWRRRESIIDVVSQVPLARSNWKVPGWKNRSHRFLSHRICPRAGKRDVCLVESAETSESYMPAAENTGIREVNPGLDDMADRKVVSVLRHNNEIVTEDGQLWTVSTRPNNSFDFTTMDAHGVKTVARWVPAKSPRPKASKQVTPPASPLPGAAADKGEVTYHFSLIDPSTRRHAVLATLSPSNLVIKETYHEPKLTSKGSEFESAHNQLVDRTTRTLILATAVWLDLHLGWSPSYGANGK